MNRWQWLGIVVAWGWLGHIIYTVRSARRGE